MKQLLYSVNNEMELKDALNKVRSEADTMKPHSILLRYFCGETADDRIAEAVIRLSKELVPEAEIVGISTGGEIAEADIQKPCVLLSALLFEKSAASVMIFTDIYSREEEAAEELYNSVCDMEEVKGVEILMSGPWIDASKILPKMKSCEEGIQFFGGYAAAHNGDYEDRFILTKDGVIKGAMAVTLFSGKDLHIQAGRTSGWRPIGQTFKITRADDRRLYTVNDIAAYDLYYQFLKFPDEYSFRDYAMEFPLIVTRGKMKLVRHPLDKYPDNSIQLDGPIKTGDTICFSYGAPLEIIKSINKRCRQITEFEPEAVLIYSCIGRRAFWGNLMGWEMSPFQKIAETGGACFDGEFMRNNVTGRVIEHRMTLVSVGVREGDKAGLEIPEIEVDDEMMKKKMSLVYRMSTLIESMVGELQKTNAQLSNMNQQLAAANEKLHRIAITDGLTGLYNRREIEARIKAAIDKAKEEHKKAALVMLDIDFFKKINDTYGHDTGDLVLKQVSAILKSKADEELGQSAGRWGGEEFFLVLPDEDLEEALEVAEKIRIAVEHHYFPEAGHLTVSLGVTCADADSDYQTVYLKVDQALYDAKHEGRNCVIGLDENKEEVTPD